MKAISNLMLSIFFLVLTTHVTTLLAVGAHEHGKSYMTVVLDDLILSMSLKLAASDVVGFEHQPANKSETHIVDKSVSLLSNTDKWLNLTGGVCTQKNTKITNPFAVVSHENKHDHSHEDEHNHENSSHHDFYVDIEYSCADAATLTHMEVNLQNFFNDIHEIEVQWIIHDKQGLSIIESNNQEVRFNHER